MYQQNNKQDFLANAAKNLYGKQRKKEEEEKSLRNSLLNELGDNLTPAQTLYSSNEELKKMRDEMNAKKSQDILQAPLPESKIQQTPYVKSNDNKEPQVDLTHKPKLLDKIPTKKEELVVSAKIAPEDWDKNNETPAVDYREKDTKKENDNSFFSDEAIIKARNFIQNSEGYREDAYQDTGGVWTIGYGHTKNVKPGDKITKEEAQRLYQEDFNAHSAYLKHVKVPLNNNEKIALVSLIYNIGPGAFQNSTLLKKLNAGDKEGAAKEFDRWIYDNGTIQQGLINRRKKERALFSTPDED